MKKLIIGFIAIILVLSFAAVAAAESGVTDTGSYDNELYEKAGIILDSYKSITNVKKADKEILLKAFDFSEGDIKYAEKLGLTLADSISFNSFKRVFGYTDQEILSLMASYEGDEYTLGKNSSDLYSYSYYYGVDLSEKTIKDAIKNKVKSKNILDAYMASEALDMDISLLMKTDDSKSNTKFDINDAAVIEYMDKNKVDKETVEKKIEDEFRKKAGISSSALESEISSLSAPIAMAAATTYDEQAYDKYFTAPYRLNIGNDVETNSGNLNVEDFVASISGINGLDVNIAAKYSAADSQNSGVTWYMGDFPIYDVYQTYHLFVYFYSNGSTYNGATTTSKVGDNLLQQPADDLVAEKEIGSVSTTYYDANNNPTHTTTETWHAYKAQDDNTDSDQFNGTMPLPMNLTTGLGAFKTETNLIGMGWSLNFPYFEKHDNFGYIHLPDGRSIPLSASNDVYSVSKYVYSDVTFATAASSEFTGGNGTTASAYKAIYKDGTVIYFASEGRCLGIEDRFGNSIKYDHFDNGTYYVVDKIIDTVGREINLTYTDVSGGKRLTITLPDSSTVIYNMKPFTEATSNYYLYSKTDQEGNITIYDYDYSSAKFANGINEYVPEGTIYYGLLSNIEHPTGGSTEYTFEKIQGHYMYGYLEYYSVSARKEVDSSLNEFNEKSFTYTGSYRSDNTDLNGYLPTGTTYEVEVNDQDTKTKYFFDNKHMAVTVEKRDLASNLINKTLNTYTDDLLSKSINQDYNSSGVYMESITNYEYDSGGKKNLIGFWDEKESRDSNGDTTGNDHKTTITYNSTYNYKTQETYKQDADTTIRIEYVPYTGDLNIQYKKIWETKTGQSEVQKEQSEYIFDTKGNVIEIKKYEAPGFTNSISSKFNYDDNDVVRNGQFDGAYLTRSYVESVTDADGLNPVIVESNIKYDVMGRPIETTDGNGNVTQMVYDDLGRVTGITYDDGSSIAVAFNDAQNNTVLTDANGYQSKKVFDDFGNLIQVIDLEDNNKVMQTIVYDSKMRVYQEFDYNNRTKAQYTYNTDGKLQKKEIFNSVNTLLYRESYAYDDAYSSGTLKRVETTVLGEIGSPSNVAVKYFNEAGEEVKSGYKHNTVEYLDEYVYDYKGNVIEVETARDIAEGYTGDWTEKFEYDYAGRVIKAYNYDGNYASTEYDALGNKISITDVKGNLAATTYSSTFTYDKLGRIIKEETPMEDISGTIYKSETKTYYDNNSNIIKALTKSNKYNEATTYNEIQYTFDNRDRLEKVTAFDGGTAENYTQYYYDANGNTLRMYTGLSSPLTINGLDNVTDGADSNYSVTEYTYSYRNQLTSLTDPMGQTESYVYDTYGSLIQKVDRNESVHLFEYDDLGRLLAQDVYNNGDADLNASLTYQFYKNGNLKNTSNGTITTNYVYDSAARLSSETEGTTVKSFTYDVAGNQLTELVSIGGTTKLNKATTYDEFNRMETVSENSTLKATYTYDANGNRATLTYNNGATPNSTVYEYNVNNTVKSMTNKQGTTTISRFEYEYQLDGNRVEEVEKDSAGATVNSKSYTYDGLGRLTQEVNGSTTYGYTYDDYSNRLTKTETGEPTVEYTYDDNNRLLSEETDVSGVVTSKTYSYDGNGNQIATSTEVVNPYAASTPTIDGTVLGTATSDVTINRYNGLNELVLAITDDTIAEYTYNPAGLRATKTVNGTETEHIWVNGSIVLDVLVSSEIKYVRGINLISMYESSTESFYLFNAHGDVVNLTNSTGAVTETYTYDAFGVEENPDSADVNPFRYCGEYFDKETETYYLRARYYNPVIGRFISEDSIRGRAADPLSLNLYIYCANNPVIFIDPSGNTIRLSSDATEAQIEQYNRAIEYLSTSDTGAELIDALEDLTETITIVFNEDTCDGWNFGDKRTNWTYDGSNILNWNPYLGLVLGNQTSVLSPALALAHEMGHAHQDLIEDLLPTNNQAVTDIERAQLEKDNMERFEIPIAMQLGEYTRAEYNDIHEDRFKRYFTTNNSTDWGNLTGRYNHWFLYYWFHPNVVKINDREFINKNNWKPGFTSATKPFID